MSSRKEIAAAVFRLRCSVCHGKGRVDGKPCPYCGGHGDANVQLAGVRVVDILYKGGKRRK